MMAVDYEVILKLVLSMIVGGIIGIERESQNKAGGFRTHILVGMGSTLIMIVSLSGVSGADPWRLSAQVVSGIGFLGTGTILRDKSGVSGLTTAASLWVTAGIGLAIGGGYYFEAMITGFLVMFSLVPLGFFTSQLNSEESVFIVRAKNSIGLLSNVSQIYHRLNINIEDIKVIPSTKKDEEIDIHIRSKQIADEDKTKLVKMMYAITEVIEINKS